MKIYGIHIGSIHEGGGCSGTFYNDKELAIIEAEKLVDEEQNSLHKWYYKRDRKHYEEFKWRKCDKKENRWHNTIQEIEVFEAELI